MDFYERKFILIVGFSIIQVLVDIGVNSNLISLKWPNDILVDEKKICGILLESSDNFIIVGIGLNILTNPVLETKWATTKLNDYLKGSINIKNIGLKILNKVFYNYHSWEKFGFVFFKDEINEKMFMINKKIVLNVHSKSNPMNGVFLGIGDSGGIKVKTNSKITEYLSVESFTFV